MSSGSPPRGRIGPLRLSRKPVWANRRALHRSVRDEILALLAAEQAHDAVLAAERYSPAPWRSCNSRCFRSISKSAAFGCVLFQDRCSRSFRELKLARARPMAARAPLTAASTRAVCSALRRSAMLLPAALNSRQFGLVLARRPAELPVNQMHAIGSDVSHCSHTRKRSKPRNV